MYITSAPRSVFVSYESHSVIFRGGNGTSFWTFLSLHIFLHFTVLTLFDPLLHVGISFKGKCDPILLLFSFLISHNIWRNLDFYTFISNHCCCLPSKQQSSEFVNFNFYWLCVSLSIQPSPAHEWNLNKTGFIKFWNFLILFQPLLKKISSMMIEVARIVGWIAL